MHKIEKLSTPYRVIIIEEAETIKQKKSELWNQIKGTLPEIKGFRKGHIPQDVAESRFGAYKLYQKIIDDLYIETENLYGIVSAKDFLYYGHFKEGQQLKIEFIAEVRPEVELPDFKSLNIEFKKEDVKVNERIEQYLKDHSVSEDIEKDLENLDIAIIDFEGFLEGEKKAFNGGSAKNFELTVNLEKKTFIDTFENQILGMKKGETREVFVTFPDNYRDKSKNGKKAKFVVTLKNIIRKKIPSLTEEFIKIMGYENIDDFKKHMEKQEEKENLENRKKMVLREVVDHSKSSPLPLDLLKGELERQWKEFLQRIGKSELNFLQTNKNGKIEFMTNNSESSEYLLKTSFVLDKVVEQNNLTASDDEIIEMNSKVKDIIELNELKKDKVKYYMMRRSVSHKKAIKYLTDFFMKNND